ncbi:hypothetical protein PoB_006156700 [Plakobranchus ocellatus]|uniref:Uncharacterized protein n=1 Tax=Plakobranchus ocellatus TaxID=259542 RepID=A0AAV4CT41_9GAST|nr:hypothetical protein PoB_006156700 [Plakobranchus ocellatus]
MIGQPCPYLSSDHLDRAKLDSWVAGRRGEMRTLPVIASCSLDKMGGVKKTINEITPTFKSTYPQALKSSCHWQSCNSDDGHRGGFFFSILAHLETRDT